MGARLYYSHTRHQEARSAVCRAPESRAELRNNMLVDLTPRWFTVTVKTYGSNFFKKICMNALTVTVQW